MRESLGTVQALANAHKTKTAKMSADALVNKTEQSKIIEN